MQDASLEEIVLHTPLGWTARASCCDLFEDLNSFVVRAERGWDVRHFQQARVGSAEYYRPLIKKFVWEARKSNVLYKDK